jgi:hypothetical protein
MPNLTSTIYTKFFTGSIMSKRFFGIPNFFNYAMADGIYNLLKSTKTGLVNFIKVKLPPNFQQNLFPG